MLHRFIIFRNREVCRMHSEWKEGTAEKVLKVACIEKQWHPGFVARGSTKCCVA